MASKENHLSNLKAAAESGDLEEVKNLMICLESGQYAIRPTDYWWALLEAISRDRTETVRCMLLRGAKAQPNCMPLAFRAEASNEMLKILLDDGVNVNSYVSPGRPLIHLAVGNLRQLEFLLENGADPNLKDERWGLTSLDIAAESCSLSTIQLLLNHGAKISQGNPLRNAAMSGTDSNRIPILKFLVDSVGLDVNALSTISGRMVKKRGEEDCTPLQSAICAGRKDRIQFLLERGADPSVKSSFGEDAFEYAERHDFSEGLKMLKECLESRQAGLQLPEVSLGSQESKH